MVGWLFKNCFNENLRLLPARWELPIRDYTEKLRPKGVTFLGVKGCKSVGISLRLKYQSVGKSVTSKSKKVQKT